MKRLISIAALAAAAALAASCGGDKGSPADYPKDFSVISGDSSVIATWTPEPDVEYWIFFAAGTNTTTTNWANLGGRAITDVTAPQIITGLANGTTYSFTINGRKNHGPGGTGAPTQVVTPRLAGENWQLGTPLGTDSLNAIGAGTGSGGFGIVTIGNNGSLYSSVAGSPFTARTNPLAPLDMYAVWYGSLGFVAGGPGGKLLYSIDGINWSQPTSGSSAAIFGGSSSVSTYVAVGAGGAIATSSDAATWTTPSSGVTVDLHGAAFGALRYVAVGDGGTIITSSDASNWGAVGGGLTTANLHAVSFGLVPSADGITTTNAFIAIGDNGTVLGSPDGVTWALQTQFTTANLYGIVNGGRFVMVGAGGVIFTSPDGLAWTQQTSPTTADLHGVVRTLSGYTAIGDAGTIISTF